MGHPLFRLLGRVASSTITILDDAGEAVEELVFERHYRSEDKGAAVRSWLAADRWERQASAPPAKQEGTKAPRKPASDTPVPKPAVKPAAANVGGQSDVQD
jgi:hypothetical protein